jgi:hypothetical protein
MKIPTLSQIEVAWLEGASDTSGVVDTASMPRYAGADFPALATYL